MSTLKRKANTFKLNSINSGSAKRQRVYLTIDKKRSFCEYPDQNPKASQEEIANHYTNVFKLDKKIGRSTINEILKNQANLILIVAIMSNVYVNLNSNIWSAAL